MGRNVDKLKCLMMSTRIHALFFRDKIYERDIKIYKRSGYLFKMEHEGDFNFLKIRRLLVIYVEYKIIH